METESNEETCKPNDTASFGKPFRNPMMTGNRNRIRTQQQNQVLTIKQLESELVRLHDGQRILRDCMIEKVEQATEKWMDSGRQVIKTQNHMPKTCLTSNHQKSKPLVDDHFFSFDHSLRTDYQEKRRNIYGT
jgi:hypothetical protein